MAEPHIDSFARRLLAWWDTHGRKHLPWQRERTPYRVWVAEIMLQQTQVSTVVPYFERFMARFPTVETLARADLDAVLHLWSGLGYYARARNLHRAAGIVAQEHGGIFPDTIAAVQALPGIGRSTAAAIVAQELGTARGNPRCQRQAGAGAPGTGWPAQSRRRRRGIRCGALADAHTPAERVADYTQAIMDLGATVCRSSRPRLRRLPRASGLVWRPRMANPRRYPERAPRRKRRLERSRFFVVVDPQGRLPR